MKAWHFVGETLRDGRPVPPDGTWLKHDGELVICESGLHASKRLIDALQYAPGNTICRVKVDGEILHDDDKLVASKRKILWRIDGERMLRAFARWCALQAVNLWDAPEIVIEYLTTGNEEIRDAARYAAWYAAMDAAMDAAWDAAQAAAMDAARYAAWYAAMDAAWDAARDAAWYAARYAAWYAAWDAARDAAWYAAWYAARDAARSAQNTQLELMVREARDGRTEWILEVPERKS